MALVPEAVGNVGNRGEDVRGDGGKKRPGSCHIAVTQKEPTRLMIGEVNPDPEPWMDMDKFWMSKWYAVVHVDEENKPGKPG